MLLHNGEMSPDAGGCSLQFGEVTVARGASCVRVCLLGRLVQWVQSISVLLAGVASVIFMISLISSFDLENRAQVYAGSASSQAEVQAGLMGVINGVANMEQYAQDARFASVADDRDTVLAGATSVDKRAIRKSTFAKSLLKANTLGYLTDQIVEENQMSAEDYYTLLRIVEAEATAGDVESKMMVASVVLNRVSDDRFPDSITEVVYQDNQFSPTSDGRIYSCSITESTIEAVDRVLEGEDLSRGALYFVAKDSADESDVAWFEANLTWLFSYGGHDFYTYPT